MTEKTQEIMYAQGEYGPALIIGPSLAVVLSATIEPEQGWVGDVVSITGGSQSVKKINKIVYSPYEGVEDIFFADRPGVGGG